jgi:hypothetical protein
MLVACRLAGLSALEAVAGAGSHLSAAARSTMIKSHDTCC